MKFAIVVGCLTLVACSEHYQYVERGGASLRIDRSGHISVLKVANGVSEWVPLPSKEEAAASDEKRRSHCTLRPLPKKDSDLVTIANNSTGSLTVTNGGQWCVQEIHFQDGLIARVKDESTEEERQNMFWTPITRSCPGTRLNFALPDAPDTGDQTLNLQVMIGQPADCT